MPVQYFSEDITFDLKHQDALYNWVGEIIQNHGFRLGELNYIFCSDNYLLEINRQHLAHDYYTDIITFDNSEDKEVIESDIFISVDRVQENTATNNTSFENELHRVMIHGVLHLLGFDDKDSSSKKEMREKEDACLSLLKI